MQDILSLILFTNFIIAGYFSPKISGWIILVIVPSLGPTALTIAGSSVLPLTIYRVGYAVTYGIVLRAFNKKYPIFSVFKFSFVKLLMCFTLFIFLISVTDRFENMVFNFIPNHLFAIMLPFIMIKDQESLFKLLNIYIWFSAIMGLIIMLEVFLQISLGGIIAENFNPGVREGIQETSIKSDISRNPLRGGVLYRGFGLWGGEKTAYVMSFLFPLTLWYITCNNLSKINPIKFVPALLTVVGLVLMQTRITYIAVSIAFLFITLLYIRFSSKKLRKQYFSLIFKIVVGVVLIFMLLPPIVFDYVFNFFKYLFYESFLYGELSIETKINRIPIAISMFMESPLWGYLVSRYYAYGTLMKFEDLPGPIIYMLSGGLILLLFYLSLLFKMPFDLYRLLRSNKFNYEIKGLFIFIIAAFMSGIIVNFSNYSESHFIMMFILYISVFKVYKYNMWPSISQPS